MEAGAGIPLLVSTCAGRQLGMKLFSGVKSRSICVIYILPIIFDIGPFLSHLLCQNSGVYERQFKD